MTERDAKRLQAHSITTKRTKYEVTVTCTCGWQAGATLGRQEQDTLDSLIREHEDTFLRVR